MNKETKAKNDNAQLKKALKDANKEKEQLAKKLEQSQKYRRVLRGIF